MTVRRGREQPRRVVRGIVTLASLIFCVYLWPLPSWRTREGPESRFTLGSCQAIILELVRPPCHPACVQKIVKLSSIAHNRGKLQFILLC